MAKEPKEPASNNGGTQETPTPQDVDVLLDVSELEVDKIVLEVEGLRAHVSVLAELASLVSLQIGVDARLDRVKLEIEGVRAKVLLKVRLENIRAVLEKALETVAEHPEILESLTRALDEVLTGKLSDALGTLETALGGLEEGTTVDAILKGSLEDVRTVLQEVLNEAEEGVGRGALPNGSVNHTSSTSAKE